MDYMNYPLEMLIKKNFDSQIIKTLNNDLKPISYLLYQLLCGVNYLHQADITHGVCHFNKKKQVQGPAGCTKKLDFCKNFKNFHALKFTKIIQHGSFLCKKSHCQTLKTFL